MRDIDMESQKEFKGRLRKRNITTVRSKENMTAGKEEGRK